MTNKAWGSSSSATSGITAYSLKDPKSTGEKDMPIKECTLEGGGKGFKWGDSGTCFSTREKAVAQAQAAYANGYKGKLDSDFDLNKGEGYMNGPVMFAALTKVDEENRLVYGVLADETPDRADEVFDYAKSKPYFEKWSKEVAEDTNGNSVGNLRAMHGKVAAGKFTDMVFNDDAKSIQVCAKVIDNNEWEKVLEGVYTGFSIGGSYVGVPTMEKHDGRELKRYVANPTEGSLVDRPCNPTCKIFEVRKLDGSTEQRIFKSVLDEENPKPTEHQVEGSDEEVAELAKVMGEAHLTTGDVLEIVKKVATRKVLKAQMEQKDDDAGVPDNGAEEGAASDADEKYKAASEWPKLKVQKPGDAKTKDGLDEGGKHSDNDGDLPGNNDQKDYQTADDTGMAHGSEPDKSAGGVSSVKADDTDGLEKADSLDTPERIRKAWHQANRSGATDEAKAPIIDAWKKYIDKTGPVSARKALPTYGVAKAGNLNALVDNWEKWGVDFDKTVDVLKERSLGSPELLSAWLVKQAKGEAVEDIDLGELKVADLEKLANQSQGILVSSGIVKPQVFKGMYQVGQLATMLDQVAWLRDSCSREGEMEKDTRDHAMADRLDGVLEDLCSVLADMVEDEGSELLMNGKALTTEDIMKLAYAPKTLRKVLQTELEKVGRRNSADDVKHIQEIHDCVTSLGGKCVGMTDKAHASHLKKVGAKHSGDTMSKLQKIHDVTTKLGGSCDMDTNKSLVVGDLSKVASGDPDALRDIITASIQAAVEPLQKSLDDATFRLRKYEDSPSKPRGVLRAVSKAQDNGGVETTVEKIDPIVTGAGENVDEAATLMKSIHRTGGKRYVQP